MKFQDLERELKTGKIRPVYVVVGEERFLADLAVRGLRAASLADGLPDFNEDAFTAGEVDVDKVIAAARMVPMMSPRRFVLVRSVERWEPRASSDDTSRVGPLDRLVEYAERPIDSTCLVLTAPKLDARRKLVTLAKKSDFIVSCDPLSDADLARWVEAGAKQKGHPIAPEAARALALVAGPDLGHVNDALERLSLYVGLAKPITEEAISDIVVRVRETSTFEMVDAVAARDLRTALARLGEVFDPRDGGIALVGAIAWAVRQSLRFSLALAEGVSTDQAARTAGVPPFKSKELAARVRNVPPAEFERWLCLLAEADLALKGSRRPARAVLDTLVMSMVKGGPVLASCSSCVT